MATKLYILNASSPRTLPATWEGGVDVNQGANLAVPLRTVKDGNAALELTVSEAVATNPYRVGWARGVSQKLAAQTISGTLDAVLSLRESNADADFFQKIYAYVTEGETDTVRGVLLDLEEDSGTGSEFATTLTGQDFGSPATLSNVSAQNGDYLVVECAYISRNSHTTSRTGGFRYGAMTANNGDTQLADLTIGSTSALAPYVEFSADLLFLDVPNATCATAIDITSIPYSLTLDASRSQRSFTEPVSTCAVSIGSRTKHPLWWTWTAPSTGNYELSGTAAHSHVLAVWTGSCGSLTQVACNAGTGSTSITFSATASTEYFFTHGATQFGGGHFTLELEAGTVPPANSTCATAENIPSLPFAGSVDTTGDATADEDSTGTGWFNTIWYEWTAPADMYVRARADASSDHDANTIVFSGACGSLVEISQASGLGSWVTWLASTGATYRIMFGASVAGGGALDITIEELPDPQLIRPGREFSFGLARRGSSVWLPDGLSILMDIYDESTLVVRLHTTNGLTQSSGGVYTVTDWHAQVSFGNSLGTPTLDVVNPYVDEWLGHSTSDHLHNNVVRASELSYHYYAVAVRLSTFDPNTSTYASDGYVALAIDGVVVAEVDDITIDHALDNAGILFRAEIDADAVWIARGSTFPTGYVLDGRPIHPGVIRVWGFDEGIWQDEWEVATPFAGSPLQDYINVTPTAGVANGWGVSSYSIDSDQIGTTDVDIHASLRLILFVDMDGALDSDSSDLFSGVIGPIAWLDWARRVP